MTTVWGQSCLHLNIVFWVRVSACAKCVWDVVPQGNNILFVIVASIPQHEGVMQAIHDLFNVNMDCAYCFSFTEQTWNKAPNLMWLSPRFGKHLLVAFCVLPLCLQQPGRCCCWLGSHLVWVFELSVMCTSRNVKRSFSVAAACTIVPFMLWPNKKESQSCWQTDAWIQIFSMCCKWRVVKFWMKPKRKKIWREIHLASLDQSSLFFC